MKISLVTPAQEGVHVRKNWIPACAGMTSPGVIFSGAAGGPERSEGGISQCVEDARREELVL